MRRTFSKSLFLLTFVVVLCGVLYPLALSTIGRLLCPFQANGSFVRDAHGKVVGSLLIAQPFTADFYFHPRPSAASYNAAASSSSSLAPSNYALRDRIGRSLGPIVTYKSGPKAGLRVGPDIEQWFQTTPGIVAQWATLHPQLAKAWSQANVQPGKFPVLVNGVVESIDSGPEIQSTFFLLWRESHPDAELNEVPGDMVTASASGLDPHITLQNAETQLNRVATSIAQLQHRESSVVRQEIEQLLQEKAFAPWNGLAGEKLINVLEVNLEIQKRYST